ncbi:phosphoglycerate mutase-like protein [Lepidopterella palustris CBS 459.81]|uniref:Phosphoglycerate mutase-like protein n=1 Tax=Lepidopterella palustris CBS 459.81 TaxID=1314670 RepID=A0A8E2JEE7_9PEZI|nr:phosphoglycerate mutase-like protein [Lepidopterella palustris CBS 459.81]
MPSIGSRLAVFSTLIALLAIILYISAWRNELFPLHNILCAAHASHDYISNPHSASWKSWWHPQRTSGQPAIPAPKQGGGVFSKDWNILYHLGGNGPWVEKVDGVVEGGIEVPEGCSVDQVHMMSRHSERYPTVKAGTRMLNLMQKMKDAGITYEGDLQFFNYWEFFSTDPQAQFEHLTTTGPFSGTLGAFTTGVKLRTRYHNLLSPPLSHSRKTSLWASDCPRVIDTARYFSAGFFGLNWNDTATLHIIPETAQLGGDTLTPGDTCLAYLTDKEEGHDKGAVMLAKYRRTYLSAVRERLLKQNPGINFMDDEIYAMQEMCGFEITVRGSSHWCDVFTQQEFLSFEYARDVIHYYRSGPGTRYGGVMGLLWLNAMVKLLVEGPSAGPLFFSFVHDGDIVPMLTALDLFPDKNHLPITHIAHDRKWRTSQVSPMSGRVIFERLTCPSQPYDTASTSNETFVRVNINDGIVAIPGCASGPGHSCPLSEFEARVAMRGRELGDFRERCGLGREAPGRISFLHQ